MNKLFLFPQYLFLVLSITSCTGKQWKFHTHKTVDTQLIPSGSALAVYHDSILVVGDDVDFMLKMPLHSGSPAHVSLYPNAPSTRIDRTVKHDLESSVLGTIDNEDYLFVFGSGIVSPYRDTMFAIHLADSTRTFRRSLFQLYKTIREKAGLKEEELNIEGAALLKNRLFLINRGKNSVITIPWDKFVQYIQQPDQAGVPPFTISPVSLPEVDGFGIGFSGACVLDENELLFTASLEETENFTKDGQIKGSYIGILRLGNDSSVTLQSLQSLLDLSGKIEPVKLESIDVINKGKKLEVVAVADNDDGRSKLYFINMWRE